ncbi:hypothetical protein [Chloroflexus sp.]|nr:hypothetical protein [Chloroflexus sp.]
MSITIHSIPRLRQLFAEGKIVEPVGKPIKATDSDHQKTILPA